MKRILKITGFALASLLVLGVLGYCAFIYESPVDQEALRSFLEGQPIIDVHIHASKGYAGNQLYAKGLSAKADLDQAKQHANLPVACYTRETCHYA